MTFDIDTAELAVRYRELQRRVHPDKFANASDQERRLSLQMTAQVNEAFQTLKDPVRRGRYLLSLRGVESTLARLKKRKLFRSSGHGQTTNGARCLCGVLAGWGIVEVISRPTD